MNAKEQFLNELLWALEIGGILILRIFSRLFR